MNTQIYEEYWFITDEFTNYMGKRFLTTLKECLDYIDFCKQNNHYSYPDLQNHLLNHPDLISSRTGLPKNEISVRKSINQLVKFGFINPSSLWYHPLSDDYLTNPNWVTFSQIILATSNLRSSVSDYYPLRVNEINFLINTVSNHQNRSISIDELIGLMLVDITQYPQGFIDSNELQDYMKKAIQTEFKSRKYNQINYLIDLLDKLTFIRINNNRIYIII